MDRYQFPPCINHIITEIQDGGNPVHRARFALASFLLHSGWTVEDIVQLFEPVADYSERTTRYQASNIEAEEYVPPNCANMAKEQLCPIANGDEEDRLCRQDWLQNPLGYARARGLNDE